MGEVVNAQLRQGATAWRQKIKRGAVKFHVFQVLQWRAVEREAWWVVNDRVWGDILRDTNIKDEGFEIEIGVGQCFKKGRDFLDLGYQMDVLDPMRELQRVVQLANISLVDCCDNLK